MSCSAQLVNAYEHVDENIIGIAETPERDIHRFGTVGGSWERERPVLSVSAILEKPTVEEAQGHLHVDSVAPGTYYTVFGLYVLTPAVVEILRETEAAHEYDRGELRSPVLSSECAVAAPCWGCRSTERKSTLVFRTTMQDVSRSRGCYHECEFLRGP